MSRLIREILSLFCLFACWRGLKGNSDDMGAKKSIYNVNGILKSGHELTLDDAKILFQQFIDEYGHYPNQKESTTKNNIPHSKILSRILKENNIVLTEWQTKFGKIGHVRCYPEHYDFYISIYKSECKNLGRALKTNELINNNLSLPSAKWFVENCPDSSVHTYDDFVKWCGYDSNKKKDKTKIIQALFNLEKQLNRPITKSDITNGGLGFSIIVINRIWGSWSKCKKSLGLKEYESHPIHDFEYYKTYVDTVLDSIYQNKNRKIVSWRDLESDEYTDTTVDHKTIVKAFKRENLDFYEYVISKGYTFKPNSWGMTEYSNNGELMRSIYEIDFTAFLSELGLKYRVDYDRNILYSTFIDTKSKINCDYVINIKGQKHYIEIAGLLYSEQDYDKENLYGRNVNYRDKMKRKLKMLQESNVKYLILYAKDMKSNLYKDITIKFLGIKGVI
jgi:hypothetical protein